VKVSRNVNRVLNVFGARLMRVSSYHNLQRQASSLEQSEHHEQQIRFDNAGLQRQVAELQQQIKQLEKYRDENAALSETVRRLQEKMKTSLLVPKEYPVNPRPYSYVFKEVTKVFERHAKAIDEFLAPLLPYMYGPKMAEVPNEKQSENGPYWNNGYFNGDDARMAYAVAAHFKPPTIVEFGCGNSSKFFRKAVDDYQLKTQLVCIDIQPRASVSGIAHKFILKDVLDADPAIFRALRPGDVLFIDGSHLAFNGTDVVHLLMDILPTVAPGVLVHFHDIQLPHEYDQLFTERYYSEEYLIAAMLLYSDQWIPVGPVTYLADCRKIRFGGGSFWMIRSQTGH